MLFRYASFKLINPMRVSWHYLLLQSKEWIELPYQAFPLLIFSREAKTNFILIEEWEMHALN